MDEGSQQAIEILKEYVGIIFARCIVKLSLSRSGLSFDSLGSTEESRLLGELDVGLRNYIRCPDKRQECRGRLMTLLRRSSDQAAGAKCAQLNAQSTTIPIAEESDIVRARMAGRTLCRELGFPVSIQIRVATAISELARNIVQYVGRGTIVVKSISHPKVGIEVTAHDNGPGISNLSKVLQGQYESQSGMGLGLLGAKRLMDFFDVQTGGPNGTTVTIRKYVN